MVIATSPCQGLSTAGSNKTEKSLLDDPRNFLILSALKIVDALDPKYFIIENVPRFQQMLFPYDKKLVHLIDLLKAKYSDRYNVRVGKRNYESDSRNSLIKYVLNAIDRLKPDYVMIENVPKFVELLYDEDGSTYYVDSAKSA